MKKRIISLILVAVMAVLTLAGCGFNYSNEDMTEYADFDSTAFYAALANVVIEDGAFTSKDLTKRENMVLDAIYAELAKKADSTIKLVGKVDDPETADEDESEEAIGAHDLVYYCYYVTTEDGKQFLVENMKNEKAVSVQLGKLVFDDAELSEKLLEALKNFTFTEDGVYESITTGKIEDGMWVYVSYEKKHDTKSEDGAVTGTVTETAVAHRVQVSASDPFTSQLIDKDISSKEITLTTPKITVDGVEYTYDNVKVTYAEKSGTELPTFTHVLYPKEDNKDGKKVATTVYTTADNKQVDLAGVELTYHVFPTHYVKIPEYNATTILNEIYGSNIALATIAQLLEGKAYTDITGEHDHTEDHDHDALLKAIYDKYMFKSDMDSEEKVNLEEMVTAIATIQKAYKTAKEALDKAEEKYEKALTALETAKEAYDKALKEKDDAKKAAADAVTAYDAAVQAAKDAAQDTTKYAAYEAVKAAYETALADTAKKEAYDTAKKAMDDANNAVSAAQKAYDSASAEDKAAKQEALDAAKATAATKTAAFEATELRVAENAYNNDDVRKAQVAEASALELKNTTAKTETEKTEALTKAEGTLKSAKDTFVVEREVMYGTPDYIITPIDTDYEALKAAYDAAKAALEAEKNEANKQAFIAARVAFSVKVEEGKENPASTDPVPGDDKYDEDGAQIEFDEAEEERDYIIGEFITVVTEEKFISGYEYNIKYRALEDAYNLEVKKAVAKKVYNEIIKSSVKNIEAPESVVEDIYDELIDNFQIYFYENYDVEKETARGKDDETYYDMYDGSFERFMKEFAVPKKLGVQEPASYDEALALVKARATAIANERVRIYVVAEALDVKISEKEFKAYVEEKGYSYYGDSALESIRLARQLEILLDTILQGQKIEGEAGGTKGFKPSYVDYTKTESGAASSYIKNVEKKDAE